MVTEDKVSVPSEEKRGLPKRKSKWPTTPAEWISLLGTPLTILIAVVGLLVGVNQFKVQQSDSSYIQATQVASSAAQVLDQQCQATLDGYLQNMADLLLKEHLRTNSDAQALAQALTYTAVRNLDPNRKGILVRFLWAAGLIHWPQPIISLKRADLSGADPEGAFLGGANLSGANTKGADLNNLNSDRLLE